MSFNIKAELKDKNIIYFYLDQYYPLEVFTDYNKVMHKLYAKWNKENKKWTCVLKKFKEISIGLNNNDWTVLPSKVIIEKLNELEKGCETKVFRHNFDESCLNDDIKLFDYQLEDVNFLCQQNRSYNFNSFGMGKAPTGISLLSFFYMKGFVDKIFYFTKAGLGLDINRKILKFSNQFNDDDIIRCDNDNKLRLFEDYKDKKLFIIGYEFIPYVFCNYCDKMKKGVRSGKAKMKLSDSKKNCRCKKPNLNLKEKLNCNSLMMICDESHKIMNPASISYKLLNNHKEYFEFRHMMSATPNPNYYEQKWTQINLLDESIINLDYKAFCSYIAKEQGDKYSNTKIVEYDSDKISGIENKIRGWGVRRLKSDISWFKYKKYVDDPIYIELTKEQRELYNLFCNYEFSLLKQKKEVVYETDILNKFPYMSQIIDYPMMLRDKINSDEIKKLIDKIDFIKTGKMLMLRDMVDGLMERNEKVIVVDWRPVTLDYMNEYFKGKGYGCEVLHGQNVIPKEIGDKVIYRQQIIDKFNDKNSDLKILFLSSLVGGAGFDLNYACRNMIINTLSFDAENYMQMCDRIFRIINEWDVRIRILVYASTLDEKRLRMSLNREKLNNNVSKNNILSKEEYQKLFMGLR